MALLFWSIKGMDIEGNQQIGSKFLLHDFSIKSDVKQIKDRNKQGYNWTELRVNLA